jgi:alkaline phosphatase D
LCELDFSRDQVKRLAKKISRREAVLGFSSSLVLPAACSNLPFAASRYTSPTFAHGVASGDPDTTSLVIWTRVSGSKEPVAVDWYIATDAEMLSVVSHGQFTTSAERDYTVKQIVNGLAPGSTYFYQFVVNDTSSPVGRTKTLPDGHLDRLVLAVASCSNYAFGYFNAYEVIANDNEVDFVVHLGDYIYEHRALGGYGGATGRRIGRSHNPGHEIKSLRDYRIRHAQYKNDPQSIAMHARHPIIATWDDHESANNPWMEGAENHQFIDGDWFARRSASLQAYYEWMPIRDPGPGGSLERYWRHFKFGDLASLITLESRHTGRSKQITWGGRLDNFDSAAEANAFYNTIVGAAHRTVLSADMEAFLKTQLAESASSGRRWRIIGNQTVMARRLSPRLDEPFFDKLRERLRGSARTLLDSLVRLGELDLPGDLDGWDGYPAARERFYDLAKDAGVNDLLVLSGDTHGYFANALYDAKGNAMGTELGATGITSPRFLLDLGLDGTARWDELLEEHNKEIVWAESRYRGFIRLDITPDVARADYVIVTDVESRQYESRTVKSMNIIKKDGSLSYA